MDACVRVVVGITAGAAPRPEIEVGGCGRSVGPGGTGFCSSTAVGPDIGACPVADVAAGRAEAVAAATAEVRAAVAAAAWSVGADAGAEAGAAAVDGRCSTRRALTIVRPSAAREADATPAEAAAA